METKKELTIAQFISYAVIYEVIDHNLNVIADGLNTENRDDIVNDLTEIYELIISVVTLKDGSQPKNWYIPLSDCKIGLSSKTAHEIGNKIEAFKEKAKQCYDSYSTEEQAIVQNLNEPQFELAVETLVYSSVEF
jgi:hypothetical protein